MEPKYTIRLFPAGRFFNCELDRQHTLPNGALTPAQTWGVALGPDSDLDAPLPCQWEGDTEQTPISLAESFPAEYQYLKAKLQPSA
jgi:hypothetical protein